MSVKIPVPVGELFDKISILEVKLDNISDPVKRSHIYDELHELHYVALTFDQTKISALCSQLKKVNQALWNIEDDIRKLEARKQFDDSFIQLARTVYYHNDRRSELKREISILLGSELLEEKSYKEYKDV